MIKFLVNSDDCGLSVHVNQHIRAAIEAHKVTSTTIMANMGDFDGAIKMYKDFYQIASFGVHLDLTEGKPMLNSLILLDKGFYKEKNGSIEYNGACFRYKFLNKEMRKAIRSELEAQVTKILDSGVKVSHLDSHHHIHTGLFILPIVEQVAKKYHIKKMRRIGDNAMKGSSLFRKIWMSEFKLFYNQIRTTDHFFGYDEFMNNRSKLSIQKGNVVIELMCHPGGIYHPEEEEMLLNTDLEKVFDAKLISYNDL